MDKEKTEKKLMQEINSKLSLIINIMLEEKDKNTYISKLRKKGFNSKLIGDLLDMSSSTVRNYK